MSLVLIRVTWINKIPTYQPTLRKETKFSRLTRLTKVLFSYKRILNIRCQHLQMTHYSLEIND